MDFKFTQSEDNLAKEVHEFLEREVTPQLVEETLNMGAIYGGVEARKLVQKMGPRGWLCPSWPKKYGGLESSEMLKFRLLDDRIGPQQ